MTSNIPPRIYAALSEVMESVGSIAKTQTNTFDRYKFRGIDDVYNALHPALLKAGVVVIPTVEKCERTSLPTAKGGEQQLVEVTVTFKFAAHDGSSVFARVPGEGSDRGDKAVNKAMSAAYKTAMFQVFCIPVEGGSIDSEKDSPDLTPPPPAKRKATAEEPKHLKDNPFDARPSKPKAPPVPAGTTQLPAETVAETFGDQIECVYKPGSPAPQAPKYKAWMDDTIKSGRMEGRAWREIAQGSFGGQRYAWARQLMFASGVKPDTQLRAARCVYMIEMRHQDEMGAEQQRPDDAELDGYYGKDSHEEF